MDNREFICCLCHILAQTRRLDAFLEFKLENEKLREELRELQLDMGDFEDLRECMASRIYTTRLTHSCSLSILYGYNSALPPIFPIFRIRAFFFPIFLSRLFTRLHPTIQTCQHVSSRSTAKDQRCTRRTGKETHKENEHVWLEDTVFKRSSDWWNGRRRACLCDVWKD